MKSDTKIFEDVCDKLKFTPSLDDSSISVGVKDGIVTLTGFVSRYGEKYLAEDSVKKVHGVRAVADELEVRLSEDRMIADVDLARSISHSLIWDSFLPAEKIKIVVDRGFVTLSGEVDSMFEKQRAASAIRYIEGIKNISNLILVLPKVQASNVKEEIAKEFKRNALLDASKVGVEVDGSSVTLTGHVRNWSEFAEASSAAWSVPGVAAVSNLLQVGP